MGKHSLPLFLDCWHLRLSLHHLPTVFAEYLLYISHCARQGPQGSSQTKSQAKPWWVAFERNEKHMQYMVTWRSFTVSKDHRHDDWTSS